MTFFGWNRGSYTVPRTTEVDNMHGCPADEFDDEDFDNTYEAPPCGPPPIPHRQVQENIYIDDLSSPAPLPRRNKPADMVSAPGVDRSKKPGRQTPSADVSTPASASNAIADEDVYMDPDQEADDQVYLQPVVSRGVVTQDFSSASWMKPAIPRAKSNSFKHFVKGPAPAALGTRRSTLPVVLPPAPNFRPPPPHKQRNHDDAFSDGSLQNKTSGREIKEWFAGSCSRKEAEDHLLSINKDGSFLIRQSSNQSGQQPFTLVVLFQQKVFNIPIRKLDGKQVYVLGKEGKKNEETFSSLQEIIVHHEKNLLHLIDSKSEAKHTTFLTQPTRP